MREMKIRTSIYFEIRIQKHLAVQGQLDMQSKTLNLQSQR